jgi:hypothetical protein
MDKLSELKKTNNHIQHRIREITNHSCSTNITEESNYYVDMKYHTENDTTSTNLFRLKKGMKSNIITNSEFHRLICTKGSIKIHFIPYKESAVITTPNTQLILPNTRYIIEALDDSEIISVYKLKKSGEKFKIKEQETIYNKNIEA